MFIDSLLTLELLLHIRRGAVPLIDHLCTILRTSKSSWNTVLKAKHPQLLAIKQILLQHVIFCLTDVGQVLQFPAQRYLIDLFLFLKREGYCFLCCCLPLLPPIWQLLQKTPAATAITSNPVQFSLEAAEVPITLH